MPGSKAAGGPREQRPVSGADPERAPKCGGGRFRTPEKKGEWREVRRDAPAWCASRDRTPESFRRAGKPRPIGPAAPKLAGESGSAPEVRPQLGLGPTLPSRRRPVRSPPRRGEGGVDARVAGGCPTAGRAGGGGGRRQPAPAAAGPLAGGAGAVDLEARHHPRQALAREAQLAGGGGHVAVPVEGVPHHRALQVLAGRGERPGAGGGRAAEGGGEVRGLHRSVARRREREVREDILQLADVARPAVGPERGDRPRGEPRAAAGGGGDVLPVVLREAGDVRAPLAERRGRDPHTSTR